MPRKIVSTFVLTFLALSFFPELSAQLLGRKSKQRQLDGCSAGSAGEVAAFTDRDFFIRIPYEQMLERLEGEAPTREMFGSQNVSLTLFQKRENHDLAFPRPADKETVRAVFDVCGFSSEFGVMPYTTYVQANDKVALIDVILQSPAGMVLKQHYRYVIEPFDDNTTFIRVSQYLAVSMKATRFHRINRIIENITRRKMTERLHANTSQMAFCVQNIGSRYVAKSAESDSNNDDSADEESEQEDEQESDNQDPAEVEDSSENKKTVDGSEMTEQEKEKKDENQQQEEQNGLWIPELPDSSLRKIEEAAQSPESQPKAASNPNKAGSEGVIEIPNREKPATQEKPKAEAKPKDDSLKLVVGGIRSSKGTVRIAIFKDAQEYANFDARKPADRQGSAFQTKVIAVKGKKSLQCEFDDIPDGKYVIAAFHDADGNERLNASMLGLPSEAYGFSRDARGRIGSPSFESAVIEFNKANREFKINMK